MSSEFCPTCGTGRAGAFRFCPKCGFDFDAPPLAAPGPVAPVPPTASPAPRLAQPVVAGWSQTPQAGGLNSETIRTVLLALVLAILIVPFGGPATLPALLVVASLAAFDLWRQAKRREQIAANVSRPAGRFASLNVAQRFAVIVGGFVVVIVVVLVIQTLTKAA